MASSNPERPHGVWTFGDDNPQMPSKTEYRTDGQRWMDIRGRDGWMVRWTAPLHSSCECTSYVCPHVAYSTLLLCDRHAMPCYAMPFHTTPCQGIMPCPPWYHAMSCRWYHAMSCLCHVMPTVPCPQCHAMPPWHHTQPCHSMPRHDGNKNRRIDRWTDRECHHVVVRHLGL